MNIEQIAATLRDAAHSKKSISPIRAHIGDHDEATAYQIQKINHAHRISQGARMVGKKIGLTSFKVQEMFGISTPDFGILYNDMEILTGQHISMAKLMQPKVEAELAFVLGQELRGDTLTILDVINAVDYVLPSIELVGSRITDWDIKITDTIADNASASHYILGHTPKMLDDIDVVNCHMEMHINGRLSSSGSGKDCLGSPLNAVLWLARKMNELDQPLQAGEMILSGSLGPMCPVSAGDEIVANFTGLGDVAISFTD